MYKEQDKNIVMKKKILGIVIIICIIVSLFTGCFTGLIASDFNATGSDSENGKKATPEEAIEQYLA